MRLKHVHSSFPGRGLQRRNGGLTLDEGKTRRTRHGRLAVDVATMLRSGPAAYRAEPLPRLGDSPEVRAMVAVRSCSPTRRLQPQRCSLDARVLPGSSWGLP